MPEVERLENLIGMTMDRLEVALLGKTVEEAERAHQLSATLDHLWCIHHNLTWDEEEWKQ